MTLLVLPKQDCFAPAENLEPNSAGLENSLTPKEKLTGTEIQCRFSDSEVYLNFWKRVWSSQKWEVTYLSHYLSS